MVYIFNIQYLEDIIEINSKPEELFYAKVMQCIEQHLLDWKESFELEVFNSISQMYIDFDEEYAEELRKTTDRRTIKGRIVINEMEVSSISISGMYHAVKST